MGQSVYPVPSAGGGVKQRQQIITSTGTFTAPTSENYKGYLEVLLVGGGGGAGGAWVSTAGTGGGSGGCSIKRIIELAAGSTVTVTIGAGGAGSPGSSGTPSNGNASTFGALLTAPGGNYCSRQNPTGGMSAGEGSGAGGKGAQSYTIYNSGAVPVSNATPGYKGLHGFGAGGGGGANYQGGTQGSGIDGSGNGGNYSAGFDAAANTGGGGGGAAPDPGTPSLNGGAGGSGVCIVSWFE